MVLSIAPAAGFTIRATLEPTHQEIFLHLVILQYMYELYVCSHSGIDIKTVFVLVV